MKKALWIIPLMTPWLISLGAVARVSDHLSLKECFQLALKRSESLAIQEESIRIAEAHFLQSYGTILPQLDIRATETLQDTAQQTPIDGSVQRTFTRRSRPEVAISLRQPLFQGFREFQALKVGKAEKHQNIYRRDRAKQILFFDVARAYYTVVQLEKEREILRSIRGIWSQRAGEFHERVRLGKSRQSELLTNELQSASLDAEIASIEGMIDSSRDLLAFLVGQPISERLVDEVEMPALVGSVESHLEVVSSRPDLNAARESVRLAKGQVNYEKGARLPTLDVETNYYPYRPGFLRDIKWDVIFTLNVPIFHGGATRGKIREAEALFRQAELTLSEEARRAEMEIRQAYDQLKSSRARESSLRRATAKAGSNYQVLSEEYRLGLVSHVESLQALRDWQEMRLETNRAHYQSKLYYLQLKIASGDLP